MYQRAGDHQAALHPTGEHPRAFMTFFPQIYCFKYFSPRKTAFMLHVITGLIHYDLLHRFKRVKVKLLYTQSGCRLALTTFLFRAS